MVFAHDLGAEEDRTLLRYYPDRAALLLTFDSASGQEHIEPYPPEPDATATQQSLPSQSGKGVNLETR